MSDEKNTKKIMVEAGERVDSIGFGDLKLIQKPEEFCYGVDAVLLADFAASVCKRKNYDKIIDLGTGTGIIPLILSHKTDVKSLIGVELQENSWERAVRNAEINDLAGRIEFIRGDVKDFESIWGEELKGTVDGVVTNPPYFVRGGGIRCDDNAKSIARHETTATLEDFLRCGAYLLKDKGDFFMVHRPSRLADICYFGRKYALEPKTMRFISPRAGEIPNILLVHMVKGGGRELKFLPPMAVYGENGQYTEELLKAYES